MPGPSARRESPWVAALAAYNRLVEETRERIHDVPPRLAFELRRKLIHVLASLAAVLFFIILPFPWAVALAVLVIVVITAAHVVRKRRMRMAPPLEMITDPIVEVLDRTRRPNEDFPWAPVSFTLALILIATATTFAGLADAYAFAAFGILGVGDAASALIGLPYGRHKLPWNRRKSWEGTAAGALAGFLAAVLLAAVDFTIRAEVMPLAWLAVALAGGVAGAAAETAPHVEDNLVVPIAALVAMVATAWTLGLIVLA